MKKQISTELWNRIYNLAGEIYMCEVDSMSILYYGRLLGFESALNMLGFETCYLWCFIIDIKLS